jgi:formylglycine-generating enzyme required for sulfatase activity
MKLPQTPFDFSDRLTGEENVLWTLGRELLSGRSPSRAAELERELLDWREPLETEENWNHFGGASRLQTRALADALLAACALEQGRETGARRRDGFRERLASAHDGLRQILVPSVVARGAVKAERLGAAGRSSRRSPLAAPTVAALDGPAALAEEALRCLPQRSLAQVASAASLRAALADSSERLRGLTPPADRRVRLAVLTDHRGGRVFEVDITRSPSPFGSWVLSPEVQALGATALERTFQESLETALRYAVQHSRGAEPGPFWFRWSVCGCKGVDQISGGSAGGNFAAALLALLEGEVIDPFVGLTAALKKTDGSLDGVRAIDDKVRAAVERQHPGPIQTFVLSKADYRAHAESLRRKFPHIAVHSAATPREALRHLSTERAAVLDFLKRLAEEEPALRSDHVAFLPESRSFRLVSRFLLPARVEDVAAARKAREEGEEGAAKAGAMTLDQALAAFHLGGAEPPEAPHHVLVVGDPGMGKSTLLWRQFTLHAAKLLRDLESGRLSQDDSRFLVPLGLPLRLLDQRGRRAPDLVEAARRYVLDLAYAETKLRSAKVRKRRGAVEAWLERKLSREDKEREEAVLYLDAYDELKLGGAAGRGGERSQRFEKALEAAGSLRVLLTTRPVPDDRAFGLVNPLRLRVTEFTREDVEDYVERSFHADTDLGLKLLDALSATPGPANLVRVPLFLALLVRAVQAGWGTAFEEPGPRTALLRKCLNGLCHEVRRVKEVRLRMEISDFKLDREVYDLLIDALADLAWKRSADGREPVDLGELADELDRPAQRRLRKALGSGEEICAAILKVGIFVRRSKRDEADIVPETIREYLMGRWLGRKAGSEELSRALEHAGDGGWSNVWPFVVGELADGKRQREVLEALRGECEKQRDDKERARMLCTLARACAEAKARAREGVDRYVVEQLSGLIQRGVERGDCLRALAENASEPAIRAVTGFATLRPAEQWDAYELRVAALDSLAGSGNQQVIAELENAARDESETPDLRERTRAALVRRRRRAPDGGAEPFDAAALDADALRRMAADRGYRRLDDWLRSDGRKLAQYEHKETGVVFVLLPAGEFLMGSPPGDPESYSGETQHPVRVRPFLMARYALAAEVYDGWIDADGRLKDKGPHYPDAQQAGMLPKVCVSWNDAWSFCARFGWRLPSEAQWEYACRAGTTTRYVFGDELRPEKANFEASRRNGVYPVGEYSPNDFGLYQMRRNVLEWCHDVWSPSFYFREEAKGPDPLCLAGSEDRVLRGVDGIADAWSCRSALRGRNAPWDRRDLVGFRPAVSIAP